VLNVQNLTLVAMQSEINITVAQIRTLLRIFLLTLPTKLNKKRNLRELHTEKSIENLSFRQKSKIRIFSQTSNLDLAFVLSRLCDA